MSTHSAAQRAATVTALRSVPPDAPTLCEGWTAHDLAAHLVAREHRPDAGPGLLVPALAGYTEKVRRGYRARPYGELVDLVAAGPPRFSPFAIPGADAAANFGEYLLHCEDVRRAGPAWEPRELPTEVQDAAWSMLTGRSRMFFRRTPVTVVATTPDGRRQPLAGTGPEVVLAGEPVELVLYAGGRRGAARVEVTGEPAAVAAFTGMKLGY